MFVEIDLVRGFARELGAVFFDDTRAREMNGKMKVSCPGSMSARRVSMKLWPKRTFISVNHLAQEREPAWSCRRDRRHL
jgi:hypothetical protein